MSRSSRPHAMLLAAAIVFTSRPARCQSAVDRWTVLPDVAKAEARRGNYRGARNILETAFERCDDARDRSLCRITLATSLGDLLRSQANIDRLNRDTLFREAAGFYDRVLDESPDQTDALYKKALAFRSLGPHEWQESFFRDAPNRAGSSRDVFLSFLGDYFAGHHRWHEAAGAYRQALMVNADESGAREGLITALRALGPSSIPELLRLGEDWELREPSAAADAYAAALTLGFAREPRDPLTTRAMLGLVSVQAVTGRTLAQMPPEVPTTWEPCKQVRAFLDDPDSQVSWWLIDADRRSTLALAVLARGRQLISVGKPERAEVLWLAGTRVSPPFAGVLVDLQRELAMLYFGQPRLDSGGRKFADLEQHMFSGKGAALASGDLEAAQRFHTALGLIYAARGIWKTPPVRNARDQLTWAIEEAEQRAGQERFYQPLPELRALLARGLDSLGHVDEARRRYLDAATDYLDLDDFAGAVASLRAARAVPTTWPSPVRDDSVRVFRYSRLVQSQLPHGCPVGVAQRWIEDFARLGGRFRSGDFQARQQFKINADCAATGPASLQEAFAFEAFRLIDGGRVTLTGAGDVPRLERVLNLILGTVGNQAGEVHFDRVKPDRPAFALSLPTETRPMWVSVPPEDLVATRVIVTVNHRVPISRLRVTEGLVELESPAGVPAALLSQLQQLKGVRGVRVP